MKIVNATNTSLWGGDGYNLYLEMIESKIVAYKDWIYKFPLDLCGILRYSSLHFVKNNLKASVRKERVL